MHFSWIYRSGGRHPCVCLPLLYSLPEADITFTRRVCVYVCVCLPLNTSKITLSGHRFERYLLSLLTNLFFHVSFLLTHPSSLSRVCIDYGEATLILLTRWKLTTSASLRHRDPVWPALLNFNPREPWWAELFLDPRGNLLLTSFFSLSLLSLIST